MDSLSRILVGLSFMVHASVDEVNARIIPNNIQYRFESYDYDNFFVGGDAIKSQAKHDIDPAPLGWKKVHQLSTRLSPTSKFPKKDDFLFVDNDIIDLYHNVDNEYEDISNYESDIEEEDDPEKNWNIPQSIVPNTDDEDLDIFGSGSGSGSGDGTNVGSLHPFSTSSPTKRYFRNDKQVNNKKTIMKMILSKNKLNSSSSDNETVNENDRKHKNHFSNAPRKALNINSSFTDDEDLVISGSGDERNEDEHDNMTFHSSNTNSIFKVTSSNSDKSIRIEVNPAVKSDIKESGSSDDNRDENVVNSREFFTDNKVHFCPNSTTVENTAKQIVNDNEAKHSSEVNLFESTTPLLVSKQFQSTTHDEDYKLFGSGGNMNEDEDSLDSITKDQVEVNLYDIITLTLPNRTITSRIDNDKTKDKEERNLANTSEITTKMHITRFVAPDSDDEDYDFSGSGDENSDTTHSFTNSKEKFHSQSFSTNPTSSVSITFINFPTESHLSEITTEIDILKKVESDDDDYEFSGNGDDGSDRNHTDSFNFIIGDHKKYITTTRPLDTIQLEKISQSVSSGDTSNYNIEHNETASLLKGDLTEIITDVNIIKNVIPGGDDEDYELSGSGDEYIVENKAHSTDSVLNDNKKVHVQNIAESTTALPYIMNGLTTFPRTVSNGSTSNNKNNKATNCSVDNSTDSTTKIYVMKTSVASNDDDEFEFSGSGDDANSLNSIKGNTEKFNFQYTSSLPTRVTDFEILLQNISSFRNKSSNKYYETTNSLVSESSRITNKKQLLKNVISNSDNEDDELSGSGDDDEYDISVTNDMEKLYVQNTADATTTIPTTGLATFLRTVSIGSTSNKKNNKTANSSVVNSTDLTTDMYVIKTFVASNDDEDFEFSGSGDYADSLNSITSNTAKFNFQYNSSLPTIVTDFEGSFQNISSIRNKSGTKYYETTNSLGSISSGITTEKQNLKNVISNSDNEDDELSGSGDDDDDDDEYVIFVINDKENFYVQNTADTSTTSIPHIITGLSTFLRTVSIGSTINDKNNKASNSSVDNSTDLTSKMYVINTFVANNDDEDYAFSGSGDDANSLDSITDNTAKFNFQYNSSLVTIVTDSEGLFENISSSRNKSSTNYYGTKNSIRSNSSRITNKKQILKSVIDELSGSGDDDDDEYDISVTDDKEKFYIQNTTETTTTIPYITTGLTTLLRTVSIGTTSNNKNNKANNSSVDNSSNLTTKMYVIKTLVASNDDEDFEFSGSGDDANSLDFITGNTAKFNFQYNSSPPTIVTDFEGSFQNISSSRNKSVTSYYETTNSLGSNSFRITTENKILKDVISKSDNEDDELSGSGDDDDEYDISGSGDKN